jgi:Cof subfamily protein (haloacid dehalogenase superfamily)
MYCLVVCDLDGTLLNPRHRLGDYTREVLRRLRASGIDLMLASGRHAEDLRGLAAELGGRGGLISSNGAAVHDAGGKLLHHRALDPGCLDFLLHDPAFNQVHTNLYRLDDWLVERPEPYLLQYHQESGFAYRLVDFADMEPEPVLKVFFYGDHDHLQELDTLVHSRCPGRLATTFSLPVTLEVMAAGVSKGAALGSVLDRLGLTAAEVIAFGDGMNDLELLGAVGKGLVMGNADPRLKATLGHLEVIGTNADEAVAHYLDRLFFSDRAPVGSD